MAGAAYARLPAKRLPRALDDLAFAVLTLA